MNVFVLPSELNINNIQEWTEKLRVFLSNHDEVLIDCESLKAIDVLGLQLILSANKTALKEKIDLKFINIASDLQEYFSDILALSAN